MSTREIFARKSEKEDEQNKENEQKGDGWVPFRKLSFGVAVFFKYGDTDVCGFISTSSS